MDKGMGKECGENEEMELRDRVLVASQEGLSSVSK
jgi:hypothetical protein